MKRSVATVLCNLLVKRGFFAATVLFLIVLSGFSVHVVLAEDQGS